MSLQMYKRPEREKIDDKQIGEQNFIHIWMFVKGEKITPKVFHTNLISVWSQTEANFRNLLAKSNTTVSDRAKNVSIQIVVRLFVYLLNST